MRVSRKFTLIELLIVLAVILILAALLVPALKNVKDKVKEAACVDNAKQMGVFSALYSGDNYGNIPPSSGRHNTDLIRYFVDYLSIYYDETKFYGSGNAPVVWGIWNNESWADVFTCGMALETADFRGIAKHNQYAYLSFGVSPALGWKTTNVGVAGQMQPQKMVNLNPDLILAAEGNAGGININIYPNIYGLFPRHNGFEDVTVLYVGGRAKVEGPEIYDEGYYDYVKAPWSK